MVPRRIVLLAATVALLGVLILVGCGGGGNPSTGPVPVPPTFTSTPGTAAEQGMQYSYQVEASVASGGAVSFALTAAPTGAVLTGNTVTWTPTAAQSRMSNSFTVTASSAPSVSANQSWTVSPNGTITVSFIETYWTSSGPVHVPEPLQPGFPAALVPQANGSLMTIPVASASNGVFTITNVPAGNYWLEFDPGLLFWTDSSTFDFGGDEVGDPGQLLSTSQDTIFAGTFAELDSVQAADWFGMMTDMRGDFANFPATIEAPVGSTTLDFSTAFLGTEDLSTLKTIFFAEYEPPAPSVPNALVMGPELTLSNVTVTNNTTNNITNNATDNLNASPQASIGLSIQGADWANALGSMAPAGSATPFTSALILAAQPFVTGRNAVPSGTTLGPNLPLITAEPPSTAFESVFCGQTSSSVVPVGFPTAEMFIQSPILSNQDFGTVGYGDPFPSTWPRVFYFCQGSMVQVQIPGSSSTQSFYIQNGEISQPPTAVVVPLLSPVQGPQINGASLLTPATLSTGNVTLSWSSPATGQPFGYYIQVFEPETVNSVLQYSLTGQFGVTVNSINLPPLGSGTYIFMISAVADGVANMQASPRRSALPTAFVDVLSAPITINSSGSSSAAYYKASAGSQSVTNEQPGQSPSCLLTLGNPACPPKFSIRR